MGVKVSFAIERGNASGLPGYPMGFTEIMKLLLLQYVVELESSWAVGGKIRLTKISPTPAQIFNRTHLLSPRSFCNSRLCANDFQISHLLRANQIPPGVCRHRVPRGPVDFGYRAPCDGKRRLCRAGHAVTAHFQKFGHV